MSSPTLAAEQLAALARMIAEQLAERLSPEVRYFTVAKAAKYSSLSPDSIRGLLALGKLKSLRPNGRVLIDRRQLDALILGSTKRRRRHHGQAAATPSPATPNREREC
jgi:hypothetical protein